MLPFVLKVFSEMKSAPRLTAVSLFASGGIGDLALRSIGIDTVVANELLSDRADLFSFNFPDTEMICGDLWREKEKIVEAVERRLNGSKLDFLLATPPCQGMSKNGRGKLLNSVRNHGKAEFDVRNELIVPTVDVIKRLRPRVVVFENVPEMENTVIPYDGDIVGILDFVRDSLSTEYLGRWEVVEFADLGVPQRRQRLISIFTRDEALKSLMRSGVRIHPLASHSQSASHSLPKWKTVRDVISSMPPLDAARGAGKHLHPRLPLHEVPVLDEDKYFWVSNTPPDRSAFDNQCAHCGYEGNPTHKAIRVSGINKASTLTPLYCAQCDNILPRPWVGKGDQRRLMKGFTSAYKRMSWDSPCSTLTTNFAYACSDNKLHPEQNRTLSTQEALMLHTVTEFPYIWERASGGKAGKQLIRDIIGESVPPLGLKVVFDRITSLMQDPARQLDFSEGLSPLPKQLELL